MFKSVQNAGRKLLSLKALPNVLRIFLLYISFIQKSQNYSKGITKF